MSEDSGPSEVLHFECPACDSPLTLPVAAAGAQGPCPKCGREIVGPDPVKGLLARLPEPPVAELPERPPPPPEEEPDVRSPSVPPPVEEPPLEPAGSEEKAERGEPIPAPSRAGFWVASSVLLAILLAVAAYLVWKIGSALVPEPEPVLPSGSEPAQVAPPAEPSAGARPEDASGSAEQTGADEADPVDGVPDEPAESGSAAVGMLKAFLEAPDWEIRYGFVVPSERVRAAMEAHAAAAGDGPIATTSWSVLEELDGLTVFKVTTETIPEGFPVAMIKTEAGPRVDWEAYVGFHDDHLRKFLEGPAGGSGIFYVLVSQEPAAAADEGSHFVRYRVSVPMPGREKVVWIRKDSVALARLRSVFAGSAGFEEGAIEVMQEEQVGVPVVLDLSKKQSADGRTYVEIEDVVAVGWGPRGE